MKLAIGTLCLCLTHPLGPVPYRTVLPSVVQPLSKDLCYYQSITIKHPPLFPEWPFPSLLSWLANLTADRVYIGDRASPIKPFDLGAETDCAVNQAFLNLTRAISGPSITATISLFMREEERVGYRVVNRELELFPRRMGRVDLL